MMRYAFVVIVFAIQALSACAPSQNDPTEIVPDPAPNVASGASTSASISVGGSESAGAGGDGGAPPTTGAPGDGGGLASVSGARLKVMRHIGIDGSSFVRAEAFDSAIGFACHFQRAVDGSTRCFPTAWASHQSFADAMCSVPILNVPECSDDSPRFATMREGVQDAACSIRTHRAFALGDALIGATSVYMIYSGECVEVPNSGSSFFYATEIPAPDLALVTKSVDAP